MIKRYLYICLGVCFLTGFLKPVYSADPASPLQAAIELLQQGQTQQAYDQFLDLSQKGFAPADYWIATMYLKGMGIEKDVAKAITWLHRAAKQDYTPAMLVLGDIHLKGLDGQVRPQLALGWLDKAAKAGDAFAMMQVGEIYTQGLGVKANPVVGMRYVRRAAEMNTPQAQHIMGLAYIHGIGVPRDLQKAKSWLEQALLNGFEAARPDYEKLLVR